MKDCMKSCDKFNTTGSDGCHGFNFHKETGFCQLCFGTTNILLPSEQFEHHYKTVDADCKDKAKTVYKGSRTMDGSRGGMKGDSYDYEGSRTMDGSRGGMKGDSQDHVNCHAFCGCMECMVAAALIHVIVLSYGSRIFGNKNNNNGGELKTNSFGKNNSLTVNNNNNSGGLVGNNDNNKPGGLLGNNNNNKPGGLFENNNINSISGGLVVHNKKINSTSSSGDNINQRRGPSKKKRKKPEKADTALQGSKSELLKKSPKRLESPWCTPEELKK